MRIADLEHVDTATFPENLEKHSESELVSRNEENLCHRKMKTF